jgi:crotonobetainyl-CoA:carnitine CoA-transferase CaiB-like acyl-CoA transferase
MLAYGVLSAIVARERFGVGQEVDASHLGSMMMLQGLAVSARLMMGFALPRTPRSSAGNPLWNHYRCQDDQWISLGMLQPDRYWADLCDAVDRPDLATDERFADMASRAQNAAAAVAELDAVFGGKARDEWMKILREHRGDFIYTVVNSVNDLPDDPQVKANDYVVDFDHPQHGKIQMLGMPVRLSETPGKVREPAPEFGQHSEEILLDLGYDWEAIADLRKREVI